MSQRSLKKPVVRTGLNAPKPLKSLTDQEMMDRGKSIPHKMSEFPWEPEEPPHPEE